MFYTFVSKSDTLEEAELCVPIFYALIDPSSIPDDETLEHIITTRADTAFITCATMALCAIGTVMEKSSLIRDASPDLWPCVWSWMHFLDTYWEYLPGDLPITTFAYMGVLLLCLRKHPGVASVVSATPGVRGVLAHAWVSLLSTDDSLGTKELFDVVSGLSLDADIPANFEEIGMKTLIQYLPVEPMYPRVAEAVRAGLLRFIIGYAIKYGRTTPIDFEDVSPMLTWVVLALRSQTLVSWTVVTAMRGAFAEAQKSPQYREFTKLPLFQYWSEMAQNFKYRVQALEAWEATGCHWVACSKATRKFKHCAGCESAYYCSVECQRVHWRAAHRDICQSLKYDNHRSLYRRFVRRDRAFMHVLVDYDYRSLKSQISRDVVLFMHSRPDDQDGFFVHFDYTRGVQATVLPRCDFPDLFVGYRDTRIHPVLISMGTLGETQQQYVFPLGASSTVFDAGLHRIASEIPAGAEASESTQLVEQRKTFFATKTFWGQAPATYAIEETEGAMPRPPAHAPRKALTWRKLLMELLAATKNRDDDKELFYHFPCIIAA
ncbi:hypothetical protein B0H13DRAFT_1863107 [Mycena leptocephala]|nr:hypothetical protein B0H13DRAFT_1863107 [Mycena leptocephala]